MVRSPELDGDTIAVMAISGPRLSILHVAASVNSAVGGVAESVPGVARALAREGALVWMASLDYRDLGASRPLGDLHEISIEPSRLGRLLRGWSPSLRREIDLVAGRDVDIVHSHALWMLPGVYARSAAVRFEKPLVISPRGMLEGWSLARSRWRKQLALRVYECRNLRAARLFHATSQGEAESIRRFGLRQPVATIPNGVNLPKEQELSSREVLELRFPRLRGKRWLLFLGRLDPKKQLELLLDLWRSAAPQNADWVLIVAGPDLSGHGDQLERRAAADEVLRERVVFTGMLEGTEKAAALAGADLFVLPTLSENFGIAVAEALAHGTPVITTTGAPWSEIAGRRCGWWVGPSREAIGAALETALHAAPAELEEMGERGRQLIGDRYVWGAIAREWILVYRWLLDGGEPPASVRLD